MQKFSPLMFVCLVLVPLSTLHASETKLWYYHPAKAWMAEIISTTSIKIENR
jgi:hypothetical protein